MRSSPLSILLDESKRALLFLLLSGAALLVSFLFPGALPIDPAWLSILLCGIPILKEAAEGLFTRFDIKADLLVSLALIASVLIGEIFAAGEVAFIMQIGSLLEERTVAKARAGIEKLVHLTPRTARRILDGSEEILPAEEVRIGDHLRVLPGETIPVDGTILSGASAVNQAVMTGESLPVDKGPGDPVSSGTVNQFGSFDMVATRVGEDSSIQRMVRLVQSADAGKAKIVGLADRWATWIVVIALTAAALTWALTGQAIRAVTILVVFCPCALVLATPTAIMAAIGNATRHGFLVREGDALERLSTVTRVAFDKTGTLTRGTLSVASVRPLDDACSEEALYALCARAECRSEHPLGKAVVQGWMARGNPLPTPPAAFEMVLGQGIRATVDGQEILAGNQLLLERAGCVLPPHLLSEAHAMQQTGCTVIYVASGQTVLGFLALSDTLRPDAADTISRLRQAGSTPVLLTGDHAEAAHAIAAQLGITEVHAGCLPEDKLRQIRAYQSSGQPVCMVGDGINDAPALKTALVGIAMGGVGSDLAVEAADIALVNDAIHELPHLLRLSRRMMRTIRWNLVLSMTLNFVAIALAIHGDLSPVVGALVHNAGSVLVILNSSLLLPWHGTDQ